MMHTEQLDNTIKSKIDKAYLQGIEAAISFFAAGLSKQDRDIMVNKIANLPRNKDA